MYNAKYIWPGIVIFIVLFSMPFWMNTGQEQYTRPQLALPAGEKECVEPAEWMRANHMQLLNTWRDMALREEQRVYVSSSGKQWEVSLQNTCMKCHSNYVEFCDKCHVSNSVSPYCWDCHVLPKGNQ
ncbi:sulfate reduction electron transfer complex DsrMKJOP subunit DsrJ [Desulfovibrio cuneatus]|uniref:sulfate reduction electron transfer complex DsrMKJOP subunit DsrJ n=1 Tax=Desulfovibrio cuneatus TaxID=159728 RepID=UPI00040CC5BC|nr:sulfate reduction electron transfer complex DsrMKJOP subunit DsrJ [Desulfovibrio cuneatus]